VKNWAASIRAKLKNHRKKTKEPLNFLELQYVQERFLFRLSESSYKDQFVLKGGTLFYAWANLKYRPTKDLDFMFFGSLEREQLLKQIVDICKLSFPEDGIDFQWDSFQYSDMKEGHEYDGVRIMFTAKIETSVVPMKLDICTGDKITPDPQEQTYPKLLAESDNPTLKMYPKETVIAEKVHAMICLDLYNSRLKDYFDVFILITEFEAEININTLQQAIATTFHHRKTPIPVEAPKVWTEYFYEDDSKVKQWNNFLKRNMIVNPTSLSEVCSIIRKYINPIFERICEEVN